MASSGAGERYVAKGIYIASIQPRAGKSLAALGLMELASRRVERLGFFRPVVSESAETDREIALMRYRYALKQDAEALLAHREDDERRISRYYMLCRLSSLSPSGGR
jgi:phosphate acetyltransferase